MKKKEMLQDWKLLEPKDPFQFMVPIPPKHKGKTFGMSGIRIDGSKEFIMAVLSNLKSLLVGENELTRLNVAMIDCTNVDEKFDKGNGGAVCYVRLHQRPKPKVFSKQVDSGNITLSPVATETVTPKSVATETIAAEKAMEEQLTAEDKLDAQIRELEAKAPAVGFTISDDPDEAMTLDQLTARNRAILNED